MSKRAANQLERCEGCGGVVDGRAEGCREVFDQLVGRDFSDPLFFHHHRLAVDAYCLQHPEAYCQTAKSFAAHLVGLQMILESGASSATGDASLQRWLNGSRNLTRPQPPSFRGRLTVFDVAAISDPREYGTATRKWAESTWIAYESLHDIARDWAKEALGPNHQLRDRRAH